MPWPVCEDAARMQQVAAFRLLLGPLVRELTDAPTRLSFNQPEVGRIVIIYQCENGLINGQLATDNDGRAIQILLGILYEAKDKDNADLMSQATAVLATQRSSL